jgi:RNA polymerase sigma factor (sigma-70 family)
VGREPRDWNGVLDRLLAGDHLAFLELNRLISSFLAQLRAYELRPEWEDLRQEVVLSVVANARGGRLRDRQALVGYVRIITRNKVVDRLKTRVRRHERDTVPWDDDAARSFAPSLGGGRDGGDPDAARDLWAAVGDLPDEQQRVVDGIYRQGKTYEAVAADTGIPLGTMKRRLRDALVVLRARFAHDRDDG